MKTKKLILEENVELEILNEQLMLDSDEMIQEMADGCELILKLKEEIAYLNGVIDGSGKMGPRNSSADSDEGVLKLKGFSVAVNADMPVKAVDAMAHACQDQMDWCDENEVDISGGGNAEQN